MNFRCLILTGALVWAGSAFAAPICPTTSSNATGADTTGCGVLITDSASGATLSLTGTGPYDGSEDMTVGLINNTGKSISSFTLTSTGADAFGFDQDGIQAYTSLNGVTIPSGGVSGYEGPNMTFDTTGVVGGDGTLVINFTTALADGANTYSAWKAHRGLRGSAWARGAGRAHRNRLPWRCWAAAC